MSIRLRRWMEVFRPYRGWLKWLAALVLLGFLVHENIYQNRGPLGEIAARGLDWASGAAALVLCAAAVLLTFVRWYLLVWAQEFDFGLGDAFRLGFIGFLLNYAAPGQVGGDLFKAALIAREQTARRTVAVATVLLDRLLGLLALMMVGAVVSLFLPLARAHPVLRSICWLFWGGTAAGVVGLAVMLHPSLPRSRWLNRVVRMRLIGRRVAELTAGVRLYQSKPRVLVLAVGMSLLGHLGMLSSFYFCARALRLGEAAPDYPTHLLVVPAAELGASFVPLPGGVGVLEGAAAYLYGATDAARPLTANAEAGGLPPQWRESLRTFVSNRELWSAAVDVDEAGENPAIRAAQQIAESTPAAARLFFGEGTPAASPETVRAMYRAGHRELAEAGGLLAALLFRVIMLAIAAVGFGYYLTARREIDEAVAETAREESAAPSATGGSE